MFKQFDDLIKRSVDYYERPKVHGWIPGPTWRGYEALQFRSDMWRYAELCWELHPPFVIEIGTHSGGTALFLTDVMARFGAGRVITIDIKEPDPALPDLPSLTFIHGDSIDPAVFGQVCDLTGGGRCLVLIDGDHRAKQVKAELDLYADLADYLIVQDTIMQYLEKWNVDGRPMMDDNPTMALDKWHPDHSDEWKIDNFVTDVTQHPGGWLRRQTAKEGDVKSA